MTYEEIMAQANNSGMSEEEFRRRDALIRKVMQHTPELAAQIARGPYRMQPGSSAPIGNASATEAWSRGNNNTSTSDVLRGQPMGQAQQPSPPRAPIAQTINEWRGSGVSTLPGAPTPSTSGPVQPGQPPASPQTNTAAPSGAYGGQQGGQPPINVNVNLGGYPGANTYAGGYNGIGANQYQGGVPGLPGVNTYPGGVPGLPGVNTYGNMGSQTPPTQPPPTGQNGLSGSIQYQDANPNPFGGPSYNNIPGLPGVNTYGGGNQYTPPAALMPYLGGNQPPLTPRPGPRPMSPMLSGSWQSGQPNFAGNAIWQGQRQGMQAAAESPYQRLQSGQTIPMNVPPYTGP